MYNLNYAPTILGVQSWREIISGGTRTKSVEYHCYSLQFRCWQHRKIRHWVTSRKMVLFLNTAIRTSILVYRYQRTGSGDVHLTQTHSRTDVFCVDTRRLRAINSNTVTLCVDNVYPVLFPIRGQFLEQIVCKLTIPVSAEFAYHYGDLNLSLAFRHRIELWLQHWICTAFSRSLYIKLM
jgi:hypothetical protein